MGVRVEVTKNDFGKVAGQFPVLADLALETVAQNMRTEAAARSPEALGIAGRWTVDHRGTLKREVRNLEWRAVFYEDGTPYLAAEPMLLPAMDRAQRTIAEVFARTFAGFMGGFRG